MTSPLALVDTSPAPVPAPSSDPLDSFIRGWRQRGAQPVQASKPALDHFIDRTTTVRTGLSEKH